MRILNKHIGRTCLVRYDDTGRQEAMILDIDKDNKFVKLFLFESQTLVTECFDQISDVGERVQPLQKV